MENVETIAPLSVAPLNTHNSPAVFIVSRKEEREKSNYSRSTRMIGRRKGNLRSVSISGTHAKVRLVSEEKTASSGEICGKKREGLTPDVHMREALGEYAEQLFNQLRGESLTVAALAYGLQLNLSDLQALRIRDVRLSDNVIIIRGIEFDIPSVIRDNVYEQMRAHCEDSQPIPPLQAMNLPFFSSESFRSIEQLLSELERKYADRFGNTMRKSRSRCSNVRLRILGWFHKRHAHRAAGIGFKSALELFDKGPRINRRRGGGRQDAYYVWRLSRVVAW